MNRRDFLKSAVAAGIGLGMTGLPLPFARPSSHHMAMAGEAQARPDIVAVRNGSPAAMFDSGIAAMGGMGRFVKRGQSVTIKPNVSWDVDEQYAGNTNPELINRIIKHCVEAGAASVTVVDHTIEFWKNCYDNSGIGAAAREAGGQIAPADVERYYHKTAVNGVVLKEALVHEAVLGGDVLINVPVLKHHGGAGITAGMKNFMGAVWDRRFYHARGLQQCIADFLTIRRPELTVIDAYRVVTRNGPRSRSLGDVKMLGMQILSTDIVAADASAARLLGKEAADYEHIRIAARMGFGEIDPAKLALRRISL